MAFVAGGSQVAGGDQQLTDFRRKLWGCPPVRQFIAGQLLDDKAVIRRILVERGDDVIAVLPLALGLDLERSVDVEPDRVRVTHHVQPVPAPALAKVRRRQQLINQSFESAGALVCDKCIHLRG